MVLAIKMEEKNLLEMPGAEQNVLLTLMMTRKYCCEIVMTRNYCGIDRIGRTRKYCEIVVTRNYCEIVMTRNYCEIVVTRNYCEIVMTIWIYT